MVTLVWIGVSQGLFAAILMLTKKQQSVSDKILTGWLILIAIDFLLCAINYEIYNHPLLISSFLLFNPALYFYVRSLTRSDFHLKWNYLLHILPYLLFAIYTYTFAQPLEVKSFFKHDHQLWFRILFAAANIISWSAYIPLSILIVHKHRMHLRDELSQIGKNEKLSWIIAVAVLYVSYCVLAVVISVLTYPGYIQPLSPHIFNYSALLILIYVMSFYGLKQMSFQPEILDLDKHIPYKNSILSDKQKDSITKRIITSFEKDKIYLNPELNMDILSEKIGVPKYQITEVINTQMGRNFYHLVNEYRVNAVKTMLSHPNLRYSVEAVGFECGFASKSSFYTVFKNITGMTPIAYRNKILEQD